MSYEQEYQNKLTTAEEAVKIVKSGDWIDFGWCAGTPVALDHALAHRMPELYDVNFRGGVLLRPLECFAADDAGEHFSWNSWHMSGIERHMIAKGCAYYASMRYSELPRFYR